MDRSSCKNLDEDKLNQLQDPQRTSVDSGVIRVSKLCIKREMANFSSEQSHPTQLAFPGVYPSSCTPPLTSQQINSNLLWFKKLLIRYMNYRATHADARKFISPIMKTVHKRLCNNGKCRCDRTISLFSHVDNCRDQQCIICKPLRSFIPTGGQKAADSKGSSGSDPSNSPRCDINEDNLRRSKRVNLFFPVTQSFQPSPEDQALYRHNEMPRTKDTAASRLCLDNLIDDVYAKSSASIYSKVSTSPMFSSETKDEEQLVRGKFKRAKQARTDDVCAKSNMPTYSEARTLPMFLSETEKDSAEEKVVGGKYELAKKATESDSNIGVSILDFFTRDELLEHLSNLGVASDQNIEGSHMINPCGKKTCNLCGIEKLMFAPKPIYCSICSGRIKKSVVYYSTHDAKASKSCVCATCFRAFRSNIPLDGKSIPKSKLQMEKNNPEDEEPWVQCDKCGAWQHQICGLYNDKNDLGGNAEYVCPKCYLVRIEAREHVPTRRSPTFGAKNLPITKLSNYIEMRLHRRLKQERKERANASQKSFDEVPGVTDLVVRVVVSANKLLQVNEQYLQIFSNEKYPSEFPYRSKVILLFQKINGVDVCLFAMYVQEYGSECSHPNERSVYISHLDSVKHFRPEIRSAYGEALRTFVYHEILIGYLDYCKRRGFVTAYIWSCPPVKGDDYIFYCHPETQKTPKPDQLRQWYKSMLQKAAKENIVVELTNFYDHFFVPNEERKIKVSAARLPYFEGAYWLGASTDMIKDIDKEIQVNSRKNVNKAISRRTLKALGLRDISGDATKDILLMEKLRERILSLKEDLFMVYLQVTCKHCHEVISSGVNWLCKECESFLLCSKCHKSLGYNNSHLSSSGKVHNIFKAAVPGDMAADTEDADAILETVYFENRNSFLSFCQGNQLRGSGETAFLYQFDSLRRAKHSSMMILYYLHGSIKKVAQDCGEKTGNSKLPRKMVKLLGYLSHFSWCDEVKINACSRPGCQQMRDLFYPSVTCTEQVENCVLCKKLSVLLKKHSEDCGNSACRVPHCIEIKKRGELFPT